MRHNFDQIINRTGTNSIKYDFTMERGKPAGTLPLWVADMDFQTAPVITEALVKAAKHGIFGYSESKQGYFEAVSQWFSKRFGWEPKREWLVKTPGVVYAIAMAIRAFTKEDDAVIIQQPVYYPFAETIKANRRKLVVNSLRYDGKGYRIDFDDFETKIKDNKVKLFVLCSPHNPVGRVWTKEELTRLGDICLKHKVIIVSDEIHADFTYRGYEHTILSSIKPELAEITILCTAPSKTFNLAGLQVSNNFIANRELRKLFREEIAKSGYSQLNSMGLVACQAAYENGAEWFDELKVYIEGNLSFVRVFLKERLPMITLVEPQGTYLLWLDFKALGLKENELEELIVYRAGLWLDAGSMFGMEGSGFQRVNIACPRELLVKAFVQLEQAVSLFCNS
jgi:cysteine-S-conjugate beta-lyase